MKINKLLPLILFLITLNGFAQSRFKEKKEQIRALKIAFITDELKLTTDEATKFWPLYNNFEEKQRELKQQKIRSYMKRFESGEVEKMSDKEATNFLNQMENTEDEMYQLRKKFVSNLKDILPPIKIIKLKKVEEDFNRKLLQQYRDKGIPK
ncbi:MAG: sensor of ECF-type sigma factor [Flavobacterium sp.]|jgi:Spy/CpxP family protein refolding chaperone|nr:sensor of ECF-type sigma factor [Flavobacterium sp.]